VCVCVTLSLIWVVNLKGQTSSPLLPHVFSNVTQTQEGRVQTVHSPTLKLWTVHVLKAWLILEAGKKQ